jgi:hypothetical protein
MERLCARLGTDLDFLCAVAHLRLYGTSGHGARRWPITLLAMANTAVHLAPMKVKFLCAAARFGRGRGKYGRGQSAAIRANSYLKNLIQSIADAKLRRMRRELELGGIRLDGPNGAWIASSPRNGDRNK